MSCSSSESSLGCDGSPAPARKRKQDEVESSDSSDDQDSVASDASIEDGPDVDTQQPPPQKEDTILSHAERRRQKKRQLAAASESHSPRKKRKVDDGTGTLPSPRAKSKVIEDATATATKRPKVTPPTADDPRRQKRQNSVWVGNLSFQTTQDALRGFFDGVGTITRVHMPLRREKNQLQSENMGFAYIDFDTPEAKVIAITLSEGRLDGRNLLIKDGDSFAGRPAKPKTEPSEEANGGEKPVKNTTTADGKSLSKAAQKILRTQKQPPAPTLFLGNLGFGTTEESIRELFEAHRYWRRRDKGKEVVHPGEKQKKTGEGEGEDEDKDESAARSKDVWIRKIRMGTFEDSGNCKGFAFVDFTSIEYAKEALVNPRNHRLNGRDLVVEYASPDAVRRGGGGAQNPKGDRDLRRKNESQGVLEQQNRFAGSSYTKQRQHRYVEQEDGAKNVATNTAQTTAFCTDSRRHERLHTRRTKPGAALAGAQRQSAAIIPSQGQKIVF